MTIQGTQTLSIDDPLETARLLGQSRHPFALAIVIETQGSTSARAGAKAIFERDGTLVVGWVGGGCAESSVAFAAVECLETGVSQIIDVDLNDEVLGVGMPCGGSMKIYVEPVIPPPTIWLLGHGRVSECICRLAAMMSFDVVVNDTMAIGHDFPDARQIIADDLSYEQLAPKAEDFVVIATQHRGDHESLRRVLATDVGYIALIASHKRSGLVIDYLHGVGFDQTTIDRVRAPCGLQISAETAEEIALSVVSEIVMVRRSRAKNT